jgi:hypothetical protein
MALAALAIGQMGVHLVFFLHITTGPDNTNNVLALACGALMVPGRHDGHAHELPGSLPRGIYFRDEESNKDDPV